MSTFVFTYRRSVAYRPEGGAEWQAWFDAMGDQVVEMGNPVDESATLGNTGANTSLGGFSLIRADDIDAALTLAKGCPALARGGGVEVGQIVDMPA